MGRGSAPQGGPGNYGGSKSAKPKKPRNVSSSFKMKSGTAEEPEEAIDDGTPAFTVTRPSRERRAELLRAHRRDNAAAAALAHRATAIAKRHVNGTSPGGELLGGDILEVVPSAEGLREARLQHLGKQKGYSCAGRAPLHAASNASPSASSTMVIESCSVIMSEQERREALDELLRRQPNLDSWQNRQTVAEGSEVDREVDIRDDELHVVIAFSLDTLASRLEPEATAKALRLIHTVLGNVSKDDPKYRRLRAANDKLWAGLLQHPELCLVLEVAGFQKSSEDQDRCMELEQLELQLQELLATCENVDEAKIDALLHRTEELRATPAACDQCGDSGSGSDNLVGRSATFVHPASDMLLDDLAIVLEAVADWTPLSMEEVSKEVLAEEAA